MIRWIASYPKSGNTWVRLFLLAYADPDGFHINNHTPNSAVDTNRGIYEQVAKIKVEALSLAEVRLLRGAVLMRLSRLAWQHTGGPAYLKTQSANVISDGMAWIPPDYTEKAVYLLRDPRDVACSWADHMGLTLDQAIETMAQEERKLDRGTGGVYVPLRSWSQHVGSWWRDHPYPHILLRYEDLSDDPEHWFQYLLNFFDITFDRGRFNQALEHTTFERLQAVEAESGYEASSEFQKVFFRKGKVGGWRDVLSAEQVERIETDHGDMMVRCNYMLPREQRELIDRLDALVGGCHAAS